MVLSAPWLPLCMTLGICFNPKYYRKLLLLLGHRNKHMTKSNVCLMPQLFFLFFFVFRAAPEASGSSQARGRIRAAAASLPHSHCNTRSKPCLQPTPQLMAILNPQNEARDGTQILMDTSQICFHCTTMGTPSIAS